MKHFSPAGESAAAARQFVGDTLEGLDPDLLFAADLLTGELVANAFLHAGTDIQVEVTIVDDTARVAVTDGTPDRHLLPRHHDIEATTGRGLQLVEAMSYRFGVDVSETSKTVWFELRSGAPAQVPSSWDTPVTRALQSIRVQLLDAPVGLTRAAQRHRGALIREAQLVLLAEGDGFGVSQADLLATAALNDLLDEGLNAAYAVLDPDAAIMSCTIDVSPEAGPAAATLAWALDALNNAATEGIFLTRPALPEVRRHRLWTIGEILRQLDGDAAIPWSLAPPSDDVSTAQPVHWEAAHVHRTTVPTVVADDDNRIITVNDAAARLLRWNPADLQGQRVTVIIPPSYRDRHVAGFTNFLLTGETRIMGVPIRVPAQRKDGSMVTVNVSVRVEHSSQGRVVFLGELRPAE